MAFEEGKSMEKIKVLHLITHLGIGGAVILDRRADEKLRDEE